jgi:hypothetical protein
MTPISAMTQGRGRRRVPAGAGSRDSIWLDSVELDSIGLGWFGLVSVDIDYGPNGAALRLEAKASKYSAVEDPPPLVTAPSRTAPIELVLEVVRVCDSAPLT